MVSKHAFGWGIAATGSMARAAAAVIAAEPGMRVAAVGSRDLSRARRLAGESGAAGAYGSYAELVGDPAVDAVYVATPPAHHRSVAELAFAAGKAVLCEKPLAATAADAAAMIHRARAAELFLMEAMWLRFNPLIHRALGLVADGAIGEVRSLNASFGFPVPYDPGHRLWDSVQGGGALLDLGVYPVAMAHLLFGEPDAVHAGGRLAVSGVDAEAAVFMTWSGGRYAVAATSLESRLGMTASIVGTAGRIDIDPPFQAAGRFTLHASGTPREFTADRSDDVLAAELRETRDCVRRGLIESPTMPLADSLAVIRLLNRARDALGAHPRAQ